MTASHSIAIAGCTGRMGHMLIEAVLATDDCALAGALDREGSPALGQDATAFLGRSSGVTATSDLRSGLKDARFLIDFTRPEGTMAHLTVWKNPWADLDDEAPIRDESLDRVLTLRKLLETAAKALSQGYDIEIVEAHHRHKVDAPSGTALKMGEVVATAIGRDLKECAVYGREGVTGERDPSTIGFATVRGGDVVGDHTVMFMGTGERIEITHKSSSRATYAQGSLRAVRFLAGQANGLFGMDDVLGLS